MVLPTTVTLCEPVVAAFVVTIALAEHASIVSAASKLFTCNPVVITATRCVYNPEDARENNVLSDCQTDD